MTEYDWFTTEQKEKYKIQTLILKEIYSINNTSIFKGGTALERVYGLDRFSEDLDFNSDIKQVVTFDGAIENLGSKIMAIENDWPSEIKRYQNMHVYHLDFYSNLINTRLIIKIDVVFEKCILPPKMKIINVFGNPLVLSVMDEKEILAEKINAIMNQNRNQPRDLYDLRFLIMKNTQIDRHLIFLKAKSKMFGEVKPYSIKGFIERVNSLESRWGELKPYLANLPNFESVSDYVIDKMKIIP